MGASMIRVYTYQGIGNRISVAPGGVKHRLRLTTTTVEKVLERHKGENPYQIGSWSEYRHKWRLSLTSMFSRYVIQCDTLDEVSYINVLFDIPDLLKP